MAKSSLPEADQVTAHIKALDPSPGKIVQLIHEIILATDKEIGERIKWNNPSFYYTGVMAPFDPKEHKRDIIVLNLFKGRFMLVFPSDATLNDPSGFLEGDYTDGRRTVVFKDIDDVISKKKTLQEIVGDWIKRLE